MLLALLVLAMVAATLAVPLIARSVAARRAGGTRRRRVKPSPLAYDPGRERRAEQRARQLLRSCVNDEEWDMYRDLGFIRVAGRQRPAGRRASDVRSVAAPANPGEGARAVEHQAGADDAPYAYLLYPHKPILAYVPATAQLLSEYCVEFPDVSGEGATRLPASDDVLAKWMALTSDETRVIGRANMHLAGRQLDPTRVRRDLWRLSEWDRRRSQDSVRIRRA